MGKRRKRARRALASQTPIVMAPKTPIIEKEEKPVVKKSAFMATAPPVTPSPKKNKKVTRPIHPDQLVQEAKKTSQADAGPVKKEDVAEDASSKAKNKK